MRIHKIRSVIALDGEACVGEPAETYTNAFIDLDAVTSCFDTLDGNIKIFVRDDGVYKTNSHTLDEFADIWRGNKKFNVSAEGDELVIPICDAAKNEVGRLIKELEGDR